MQPMWILLEVDVIAGDVISHFDNASPFRLLYLRDGNFQIKWGENWVLGRRGSKSWQCSGNIRELIFIHAFTYLRTDIREWSRGVKLLLLFEKFLYNLRGLCPHLDTNSRNSDRMSLQSQRQCYYLWPGALFWCENLEVKILSRWSIGISITVCIKKKVYLTWRRAIYWKKS